MWYLIISVIINLFIIYYFYKKIKLQINEPKLKQRSEINSLIIEFNKITKNNIDLLEEKVHEIKNLLKLIDDKKQQLNNLKLDLPDIPVEQKKIKEKNISENVFPMTKQNKNSIIKDLVKEGKNSKEIAKIMGISKAEVELYLNLLK